LPKDRSVEPQIPSRGVWDFLRSGVDRSARRFAQDDGLFGVLNL
jgi:hypothetical protein